MTLEIHPIPRAEWSSLSHAGCVGVEGKILLQLPYLSIALLRFAPGGTIHEHAAAFAIEVVCLEGQGMTSVEGEAAPLRVGERVHWPTGKLHRLWSDGQTLTTLMVEHRRSTEEAPPVTVEGQMA